MTRSLPRLLGGLLVVLSVVAGAGSATGAPLLDDDVTINHVEVADEGLQLLVSVPADTPIDLDRVSVTINGDNAPSSARTAADAGVKVRRTTVLAIDTSNSMRGERIAAAKAAASTFLDAAPADVFVGIVTFDSDVAQALAPTRDRAAARAVLADLTLKRQTLLHEGVIEAVRLTGTDGQRGVLVLSDGRDTSDTDITEVTGAIAASRVEVDVVSLQEGRGGLAALEAMAESGRGQVISATADDLSATFASEADALARQLLITAEVPDSVTTTEATIAVVLPSGNQSLTANVFAQVRPIVDESDPASGPAVPGAGGLVVTTPMMYGGLAALGLGLLVVIGVLFAGSRPAVVSVEDRISAYGARSVATQAESSPAFTTQAREAAAQMLRRNRSFEARVAARLDAAGSAMKPSEWVLLHGAIAVGAGFVGLLAGRGNILLVLVALLAGGVVPWLYLGIRKSRRLAAFDAALADTLQLIAGSLQAGLSLGQGLDTVVKEGNQPIAGEFRRVLVESRLGVPLERSLDDVALRMESKDFSWVVMAIRIQREVGGNLAELLLTVAATLREREYLRRQVKTLSAEGRLSTYVLGGLPPIFLLYLLMVRRDYVMPLFTEPIGWLMLVTAGILLTVGIFWMSRLVKVEV